MAGTVVVDAVKSSTTGAPTFQNTSGTEIGTLCRAWVNFNGDSAGSPRVRGSFNVSSVTYNSAGNYTVSFSTAMPDTNYSGVGSCAYSSGTYVSQNIGVSSFSTGSCTVKSQSYNGVSQDATWVCVTFNR